jgi:SHAQKYF class myb-like DNA-binding protein
MMNTDMNGDVGGGYRSNGNESNKTRKAHGLTGNEINTGRWTVEEHNHFVECLNIYGRDWKKVADRITTRTSAQIRSHAQKFFGKLQKDMGIHLSSPALSAFCDDNQFPYDGDGQEYESSGKLAISYEKVDSLRRIEIKIFELLQNRASLVARYQEEESSLGYTANTSASTSTASTSECSVKIGAIDQNIASLFFICAEATVPKSIWRKKLLSQVVATLGEPAHFISESGRELINLHAKGGILGSDSYVGMIRARGGSGVSSMLPGGMSPPMGHQGRIYGASPKLDALGSAASVALKSEAFCSSMDYIMTPELKARMTNLGGDEVTALQALTCVFDVASISNSSSYSTPPVDEVDDEAFHSNSKKRKIHVVPASPLLLNPVNDASIPPSLQELSIGEPLSVSNTTRAAVITPRSLDAMTSRVTKGLPCDTGYSGGEEYPLLYGINNKVALQISPVLTASPAPLSIGVSPILSSINSPRHL